MGKEESVLFKIEPNSSLLQGDKCVNGCLGECQCTEKVGISKDTNVSDRSLGFAHEWKKQKIAISSLKVYLLWKKITEDQQSELEVCLTSLYGKEHLLVGLNSDFQTMQLHLKKIHLS